MKDKNRNDNENTVVMGDTKTMTGTSKGALRHLDDLDDFKIAEGEPDVRGWDVKDDAGRKLGEVAGLMVDTGAMKVRYLEVKLDEDVATEAAKATGELDPRSEATRHVLVPVGAANLDKAKDEVRLGSRASNLDSYSRDQFDDARFFGERRKGRESSSYLMRTGNVPRDREMPMEAIAEVDIIAVGVQPVGETASARGADTKRTRSTSAR